MNDVSGSPSDGTSAAEEAAFGNGAAAPPDDSQPSSIASEDQSTASSGGGTEPMTPPAPAASGGADQTALFVPDVPNTYDGPIDEPGVEVISHTLREGLFGYEWLVAIRNTGALEDPICVIDVQSTFYDSADNVIATPVPALVDHPLYQGCDGDCGFNSCLGPGEVGIVTDQVSLLSLGDPSQIASVTHAFGALLVWDAVPAVGVSVHDLELVEDGLGGHYVTGEVANNSNEAISEASIAVYGLNSAGRPLVQLEERGSSVSIGGSWSFSTDAFEEPATDVVAFVRPF